MMLQVLFGCIALPLGDFSLLKELPRMYDAYQKVVSPGEEGVMDFIGDYLLHGKELLGHNPDDRPSKSGDFQFQHAPSFTVILQSVTYDLTPVNIPEKPKQYTLHVCSALSDYHTALFRPPLV